MSGQDWLARELAAIQAEPWVAEITRGGLWTWHIDPVKGLIGLREGYMAFGTRKHAVRVARRKLARLRRADERRANRETIT